MTVAQWQLGHFDEARKSAQELLKLQPTMTVSGWLKGSPAAGYRDRPHWPRTCCVKRAFPE